MPIDQDVRDLTAEPNFATLTTLFEDGSPQTQVMWVATDDEHVLINTEVHRAKYRNVQRDPRVAVTVWDRDNPYRYVEIRGRVVDEVGGTTAREQIDELSRRYFGRDYDPDNITSERVILRIQPERIHKRL